ncbi:MAG TPA: hypothetical protein DCW42_06005 [Bacteroidetes bacterium]|nr:hypothetical protein [Bacteroidota bacterium]
MKIKNNFLKKYNYFILILSVYVLIELVLEVILNVPENIITILNWIDLLICIIFLSDWFVFLFKAKDKKNYIVTRFFDLISSIPYVQLLRPLRIFRVVRIFRAFKIIRGLKGALPIMRILLANPARSLFSIYASLTVIIYFYCSVGLYTFEKGFNNSMKSFEDALWMSFTTLTTVGYGDIYPVTTSGRIMAAILVLTGMGLFSMLTAEFAGIIVKFVKNQKENREVENDEDNS